MQILRPQPVSDCARLAVAMLLAMFATAVGAQQEIHRCPQADGTIAFQATPCPDPATEVEPATQDEDDERVAGDAALEFVNPFDEPDAEPAPAEPAAPSVPLPSRNRAECEKLTRDAIDAIDLELQNNYDVESGERYKAELLDLTRQLRACKQL